MGLDVGIVQIDYSERPTGVAYNFAWHLAGEWDDGAWQVASGANVIKEFTFGHLVNRAAQYIESEGLGSRDAHQIMRWVRSLPWHNGTVMLHLGW